MDLSYDRGQIPGDYCFLQENIENGLIFLKSRCRLLCLLYDIFGYWVAGWNKAMDGDNGEVTIMEKRTMKKLNIGKGQRPGLRFNANGIETRKNILKAAAKLFAERGYDGTSFRDITEASGIGLGSLVYHFGVKHNLYLETLNAFLMSKERALEIVAPLNACRKKDRKSVVNALVTAIASYLREIHCNRKFPFLPAFYTRLLIDADKEAGKIVDARLTQARDSLNQFAMRLNPKLTEEQAYAWRRLVIAQIQYTMVSKKAILQEFHIKAYSPEVLDKIARSIAEVSYPLLGLK